VPTFYSPSFVQQTFMFNKLVTQLC